MSTDLYKTLGVKPNATQEAIAKAGIRLLKIHNPDIPENSDNPGALRMAQEINEARSVLGNVARRSLYDSRRTAETQEAASPPSSEAPRDLTISQRVADDVIEFAIVRWIIKSINKEYGVDLYHPAHEMAFVRVTDAARKVRIALETARECEIALPFITARNEDRIHFHRTFSRLMLDQALTCSTDQTLLLREDAQMQADGLVLCRCIPREIIDLVLTRWLMGQFKRAYGVDLHDIRYKSARDRLTNEAIYAVDALSSQGTYQVNLSDLMEEASVQMPLTCSLDLHTLETILSRSTLRFRKRKEHRIAHGETEMTDTSNRFIITAGKQGTTVSRARATKPTSSDGGKSEKSTPNTALDLVFVIDSTGSMSSKIKALMSMCEHFVDDITKSGISYRAAIVAFGDLTISGDKIQTTSFTANVQTIKSLLDLKKLPRNDGGGNEGESSFEAIQAALKLPFQSKCIKVIVLMTDEPALQHNLSPQRIQGMLVEEGCMLFAFATGDAYYKSFAKATGGGWWDIESTRSLDSVLSILKKMAASVTMTVTNVVKLAQGDVKEYLRLTK